MAFVPSGAKGGGRVVRKDVYCDGSSFSRGSQRRKNSLRIAGGNDLIAEVAELKNAEIKGELSASLRVLCGLSVLFIQKYV